MPEPSDLSIPIPSGVNRDSTSLLKNLFSTMIKHYCGKNCKHPDKYVYCDDCDDHHSNCNCFNCNAICTFCNELLENEKGSLLSCGQVKEKISSYKMYENKEKGLIEQLEKLRDQ